jgi:DNA-binding transcriptional regulator YdaS (Cro superfamily)
LKSHLKLGEGQARFCAKQRGNQSALARQIGVSRQRLNDWLNNRVRPSLERGRTCEKASVAEARRIDNDYAR